ncbi:MAG: hypothetical protein K2X47_08455 [Bdellovibrionales bacterium]|nr:hypothetical protein [Bdellovibrionales bacterium]
MKPAITASLFFALLCGCGQKDLIGASLQSANQVQLGTPSTPTTPTTTPTTINPALDGKIDANCMADPAYDSCIFLKNPIAQRGAPIPGGIRYTTDLSSIQTYGVKLVGLGASNMLENRSLRILMDRLPGAQRTSKANWKKPYANDPNHNVSQVMAYYWLNYQLVGMKQRTGVMYTENKAIPVSVLDEQVVDNAYWDGDQIVMGIFTRAGRSEAALSADVYLHEMGHADLQYATNNAIADDPNTETGGGSYWCKTVDGCMSAINEGQADFHYLLMFPDKTALGESFANSIAGLGSCGNSVSRDVSKTSNLKASEAYAACTGVPGEGHVMGTIYASVWWGLYTSAGVAGRPDIEKMFGEHLKELRGRDKFADAGQKMINIDKALFAGKYAALIRSSFAQHGIRVP